MAKRRPLASISGYRREVADGDYLAGTLLQSPGYPVDIVPWQSVAMQSAILLDGVTALITANQLTYQSSWAVGRQVYLEIIGGASLAGGGCVASLLDPDNKVLGSVTATSAAANGITVARSPALALADNTVYRPAFRATPAIATGITLNLTASLRLMRLVFV